MDLTFQAGGEIEFVAYVSDDRESDMHEDGSPIVSLDELAGWDDIAVFVPIHDPAGRRSVYDRLTRAGVPILGSRGLPHLAHPSARLGEGVIVPCTTRVGFGTTLGRGTLAFSDLVAHDVTVGEFTTLASSSVVLGHVEIGDDVYVGAGSIIRNGTAKRPIRIGDGAVIGVGAVVDRDVEAGEVVMSPGIVTLRESAQRRAAAQRAGTR